MCCNAISEHENRNKADTGAPIEKKLSLEKRLGEVEKVIDKLYEDYALGKAGADEIDLLLPKYRKEQGELKGQLALFQEESNEQKETAQNAEKWVALIRQYSDLQELTAGIIRELITKIYVGDVRKSMVRKSSLLKFITVSSAVCRMGRGNKQFLTENPNLQNNLAVNITLVGVYRSNRMCYNKPYT